MNQTQIQTFVKDGILFTVEQEEDGKFVVDIALTRGIVEPGNVEDWARVVGRFDSLGDAITAAKSEISDLKS